MQKAWIEKMMERGLCSCDDEHMFDCSGGSSSSSSSRDAAAAAGAGDGDGAGEVEPLPLGDATEQRAFDQVLDRILGEKVRPRYRYYCSAFVRERSTAMSVFVCVCVCVNMCKHR